MPLLEDWEREERRGQKPGGEVVKLAVNKRNGEAGGVGRPPTPGRRRQNTIHVGRSGSMTAGRGSRGTTGKFAGHGRSKAAEIHRIHGRDPDRMSSGLSRAMLEGRSA